MSDLNKKPEAPEEITLFAIVKEGDKLKFVCNGDPKDPKINKSRIAGLAQAIAWLTTQEPRIVQPGSLSIHPPTGQITRRQ